MATYNITVTSPGFYYNFSGSDSNGTINSSTQNPTINVNTGDTINFTFNTSSNHPIDILSIGVNNAYGGTTASYTFSSAMTHAYQCDAHGASMSGSIIASSATTTTTTTTSSTTTTTTFAPINDDGDPVWNGDYYYFIYVYQSGSTMPPGISGGVTRSGSPSFVNRNNFFDTWIPDALHYRNVELQWQIAGANVSRRQGWEDRGNPETRAITYDSLDRAQYSNTILPADYEPRSVEVEGTGGGGCIEIYRETLRDFDSPDTIGFSVNTSSFEYYQLQVSVAGNWLTYDTVCPPEDIDEWVNTYDSKYVTYSLTAEYNRLASTATNDSISKKMGPSSLPEGDPNFLLNGDLFGEGQLLYTPSECMGAEQSNQTMNAILRILPQGSQGTKVGQLETYHSIEYSKSIEVTLSGKDSVNLHWSTPRELELTYDYTDSEWYMAHINKDRTIREKYEYYGDDKYEIYGYEFQWISNKPDETGWHHWFKITGDDVLPTDDYKDANGESQSRDLFYASSEVGEDLGYTRTIVRGRDGELHRGGLQLELSLTNSDIGGITGQLQPGLGFVQGVAGEIVGCGEVKVYNSYQYRFRVRAIYRCNRITNRSSYAIMPDGTYQRVPQATILLASSEYFPHKSTDPLPVVNKEKGHPFGVSFNMDSEGTRVLPTTYNGKTNMKSYDIDSELDDPDGTSIDDVLDPLNQTPTTTTTEPPEYPID